MTLAANATEAVALDPESTPDQSLAFASQQWLAWRTAQAKMREREWQIEQREGRDEKHCERLLSRRIHDSEAGLVKSATIHRLHGWIAATASGPDFIRITCNSEEILCCRITSYLPTIRSESATELLWQRFSHFQHGMVIPFVRELARNLPPLTEIELHGSRIRPNDAKSARLVTTGSYLSFALRE
ncbi:MAG: hypothetical protein ABSH02_05165 [Candidatus Sulfotelmatobacter sp.]